MKADITDFLREITELRDSYISSGNQGGARVSQQAITLSEVYSKYDFSAKEFFGYLLSTMEGFTKIYESYEIQEKDASQVVIPLIERYHSAG